MSQARPTDRAQRYANNLNLNARLAATASRNARDTPAPAISAPQPQPQPPVMTDSTGGSPPSSSDSSSSSEPSDVASDTGSDVSNLPWSPAYPGPIPTINLLAGAQPRANTDFTIQLPWPFRLCFQWNFLRLYGTTMVAVNDGREPDYLTGRVYGYIDRRDPNTASTVTRLHAFFRLSTFFHLHRIAVISGILYRIPLTLLRYSLMHWGVFPLFEYDFLFRMYLDLMVAFLGLLCLNIWPLDSWGHVCRVIVGSFIQAAVRSYFHGQKEIMDLIFQLHPVVWISGDVVWNILYQHTTLPVPSASTMWYIAGLDINPCYLFLKLYVPLSRAYTRWSYCGNFGKEVQGLYFLTPEADFPYLLQGLQEPLTTTSTVTKQPTVTDYRNLFYSVPYPTIVAETDTKTIFQGPITEKPILSECITERTSSIALVTAFIATIAQTITKTLTGRSSDVPLPDSTCPWTYTGTCTTPSPEPYGH